MIETKWCWKCKLTKSIVEFNKDKNKTDGLQTKCRNCCSEYKKKWYKNEDNKKKIYSRMTISRNKKKELLKNLKADIGCYICGEKEPCALDFHHLDNKNKIKNIAKLKNEKGLEIIFEELKKCIVLCANCHRKYHEGLIVLE